MPDPMNRPRSFRFTYKCAVTIFAYIALTNQLGSDSTQEESMFTEIISDLRIVMIAPREFTDHKYLKDGKG